MELGYRGSGEVLKREEFELRKQAAAASKQARRDQERCGMDVSSFQGVGIEEFRCIQRCPHFRGLE